MSDGGALHPERIAQAITHISLTRRSGWVEILPSDQQTCLAALKLIQKIQQKTGLTPTVADFGAHVLGVLKGFKSLR